MAPTLVGAPFHRPGWIYEEKVDGYRMLAYKGRRAPAVRLVSRNGVDHTRRYPDVAAAFAQLKPSTLVLDGELAVFDDQLRSRRLEVILGDEVVVHRQRADRAALIRRCHRSSASVQPGQRRVGPAVVDVGREICSQAGIWLRAQPVEFPWN